MMASEMARLNMAVMVRMMKMIRCGEQLGGLRTKAVHSVLCYAMRLSRAIVCEY